MEIGCGKHCIELDEDGCVLWTFDCGKTKGGTDTPTTCNYCGECTGKLASLGLKTLAFRKAIKERNERRFAVTVKSTETLLREYGVLEI